MSPAGRSGIDPGLVIDLPGARLSPRVPSEIEAPPGCVRRIRVGAHPGKVRIVVEMDPDRDYEIHPFLFRDALVIEISPQGPAATGREPEKWGDPPEVH
jgi:hypothetical protein